MNRTISTLLATGMAAIPAGTAWAAVHPAAPLTATPHSATAPHSSKPKPSAKSVTHKVAGPGVDMQWGTVQVTLIVKNKHITDVQASAPMERPRSAFINSQVIPWLRSEVLKAQSANIDGISGATMTSYAYYESLQSALSKAHKAHYL